MNEGYNSALAGRYTNKEMQYIFSDEFKFKTWRKCWVALAEAQCLLGLEQVKPEYLEELKKAAKEPIDYEFAKKKEKEIRHDVMAHVEEFGNHCPNAKGIIHLGATSMYVCDNTELIQMKEGLSFIKTQVVNTIDNLTNFALKYKNLVTLGYTHYQPAQPTTVGKRTCLYIQDLLMDLNEIKHAESLIVARGAKGTVGTQASYLALFDWDVSKIDELDKKVSKLLGFYGKTFPITGQTYPRKLDAIIISALAGIGASAGKFGNDLRFLSNLKQIEEPFTKNQTGSSAMPYKRNPMRSERMCSLSRALVGKVESPYHTAVGQWFERTLDDSAIRRLNIPETFLLANAVMKLYQNISNGMIVYPAQIKKILNSELPFMASEIILMDLSKKGCDRQEMHKIIKQHSVKAGKKVKEEICENDLFERLAKDNKIPVDKKYLEGLLKNSSQFAGAAQEQTEDYIDNHVKPVLEKHRNLLGKSNSTVNV